METQLQHARSRLRELLCCNMGHFLLKMSQRGKQRAQDRSEIRNYFQEARSDPSQGTFAVPGDRGTVDILMARAATDK